MNEALLIESDLSDVALRLSSGTCTQLVSYWNFIVYQEYLCRLERDRNNRADFGSKMHSINLVAVIMKFSCKIQMNYGRIIVIKHAPICMRLNLFSCCSLFWVRHSRGERKIAELLSGQRHVMGFKIIIILTIN